MAHPLTACPFSQQIWHEILSWLRMTCRPPALADLARDPSWLSMTCRPPDQHVSLAEWWPLAKQAMPKPMRKGLASVVLLTPWMIWKHRNECISDGSQPSIDNLVAKVKEEAAIWATAGAPGLHPRKLLITS